MKQSQNIYPLPDGGYVDVVPTKEGYNHIALFRPANSSTPQFLTSGEWEVSDGITSVDGKNGIVYFRAASPSSIERRIYSVNIPAVDQTDAEVSLTTLTANEDTYGIWNAQFSPEAGFYILSYDGPGIPWSSIVKVGDKEFDYPLTDNEKLKNATELYESAVVSYSTITSDGYELNVKEIRPPRMDDSGRSKYPVLFKVYGGPGSQMVDVRFNRDWEYYLACSHQYVIVIVDGRGTGFKGRALRNVVKGNLGFFETKDQINAAKYVYLFLCSNLLVFYV
jgi:dipeptidyl aminopeptidase